MAHRILRCFNLPGKTGLEPSDAMNTGHAGQRWSKAIAWLGKEAGGVLASAPYQTLVASRFVKSPENSEQITCLLSQASKQP